MEFNDLSEGEWQRIGIRGAMELFQGEETLFLLDEPDTFAHPSWQWEFVPDIEKTVGKENKSMQAVFITHSPLVLSSVKDDIFMMEKGKNIKPIHEAYGESLEIVLTKMDGDSNDVEKDFALYFKLIEERKADTKEAEDERKRLEERIRSQPFGNCPCRNVDFILQIVDMIYIRKTQPPESLPASYWEYIELEKQRIADNFEEHGRLSKYPEYNFDKTQKKDLREQLYKEQRALCCYCMKIIEIDNQDTSKNATIEHFLPDSVFKENCADYFNLYLTCPNLHKNEDEIEATSDEKHCDKFKGNYLIPKFIGYLHRENNGNVTKCEDFFQYNANGYILPSGSYKSLEDFKRNYENLGIDEKAALLTIEILNLNAEVLRKERLEFIKDSIQTKIFTLNDKDEVE